MPGGRGERGDGVRERRSRGAFWRGVRLVCLCLCNLPSGKEKQSPNRDCLALNSFQSSHLPCFSVISPLVFFLSEHFRLDRSQSRGALCTFSLWDVAAKDPITAREALVVAGSNRRVDRLVRVWLAR